MSNQFFGNKKFELTTFAITKNPIHSQNKSREEKEDTNLFLYYHTKARTKVLKNQIQLLTPHSSAKDFFIDLSNIVLPMLNWLLDIIFNLLAALVLLAVSACLLGKAIYNLVIQDKDEAMESFTLSGSCALNMLGLIALSIAEVIPAALNPIVALASFISNIAADIFAPVKRDRYSLNLQQENTHNWSTSAIYP
ncbi:MAG: hypothetical protein LCH30_08830 [Proteobacteria bacterium]|nr:hypothetical protein [Pseudomonadota bacterium]